jgi:hypothetical protein
LQDKTDYLKQTTRFNSSQNQIIKDNLNGDFLLYDKLNDLSPIYQQIQNLLSDIPVQDKKVILTIILIRSLNSENPLDFINNELNDIRKMKIGNSMINDMSSYLGFDKSFVKEFLKMRLN